MSVSIIYNLHSVFWFPLSIVTQATLVCWWCLFIIQQRWYRVMRFLQFLLFFLVNSLSYIHNPIHINRKKEINQVWCTTFLSDLSSFSTVLYHSLSNANKHRPYRRRHHHYSLELTNVFVCAKPSICSLRFSPASQRVSNATSNLSYGRFSSQVPWLSFRFR